TFHFNQNSYNNRSVTQYSNINRFDELWRLSRREVKSVGDNRNPVFNLSYTLKGKPGETLRVIAGMNFANNSGDRDFYQEYLNPVDHSPNGTDSTQEQLNNTRINGRNIRTNYDRMLNNKK